MMPLLRAVLLLASLGSLPVSGAKPHADDISTVTPEEDWFRAAEHVPFLETWCRNWEGLRDLDCFDFFSYSRRVSCRFERHGFRARSFDIRASRNEDLLSRSGFLLALGFAMEPLGKSKRKLEQVFTDVPCVVIFFCCLNVTLAM